ncbi:MULTISPECIES: flagellar hook-associated family protein [Methylosinus]|uniref:Flagellin n=1 Tax=Methylosinus trichosporium (strain ATCC 35070 / NCIMB 11131 / UNIQEM 75 / OB3b) TaxID=595536 RepID=A0A2D2D4G0_METT3|nr:MULTISPECIES: flagellar hook-associated family protein [Methylosinus]ATQ69856.1 flagellar hook-associated 3 family protein [Methylosinus trichosporium OB3b]OBS54495.1 flagellar hook-associated 3 family protein [Methylosinus sp. 3S-1]
MVSITSTASLANALRKTIVDTQNQMSKAQVEVSTGRVADLGLALGGGTAQDVSLGVRSADLSSITNSNAVIAARLSTTDTSLETIATTAQNFLETLVGAQSGAGSDAQAIQDNAVSGLKSLIGALDTSIGGVYLFGGVSTSTSPIADYFSDPPSASKDALDQAFVSAFGVTQSDDAVGSITQSQMQSYLEGGFSDLFSASGWTTSWSSASDRATSNRISLSQIADTSVSANDSAFRGIAAAYAMVADSGVTKLGSDAYNEVLRTATTTLSSAIGDLTRLRASVGVMQTNVSNANDSLTAQQNALASQIGALENVDPYEASTRLNNLTTQLETSYTLTGKIQQLTLTKYI